jgi:hypothetical protein
VRHCAGQAGGGEVGGRMRTTTHITQTILQRCTPGNRACHERGVAMGATGWRGHGAGHPGKRWPQVRRVPVPWQVGAHLCGVMCPRWLVGALTSATPSVKSIKFIEKVETLKIWKVGWSAATFEIWILKALRELDKDHASSPAPNTAHSLR